MGIFTKEEKYNSKTGKWETTKKGVKLPFTGPEKGTLEYEAKKFERKQKKKTTKKRKKKYKNIAKKIDKTLDWIEGKPPKKTKTRKTRKKPQKQRYTIKNGVAYPVYTKRKKKPSTPRKPTVKRKSFDYSGFNTDFDLFGTPRKKSKKKKQKKKDPFDLKINW